MKRNTYLSALLFAGLFLSSKAIAAGECLAYAGSQIVDREFSSSTCPVTSFAIPVGDVKCEIVRTGDFICIPGVGTEKTVGGPWKYSGGLYNPPPAGEPPPPLPPMSLPPPLTAPAINPSSTLGTDSPSFVANTNNSLVNLVDRMNSISQFLNNDAASMRNAVQDGIYSVNNNIAGTNNLIVANTGYVMSGMSDNAQSIKDHAETLWVSADERENLRTIQVKNKLDEVLAAQLDNEEVLAAIDDVKNNVISVQNQLYDPMTRDAKHNELLSAINNSSGGGGDGELTVSILGDISNTSQLQLGETMDGFQAVKSSVQNLQSQGNNNTDRIVNAVNNPTGLTSVTNELQAVGGKLDGLLGQGQGLSQQLGQQLNGIQTAIENSSGGSGGSDDDTETNQKLDGLGEKLDGIGQGIDGINDALKAGTGQSTGPSTCEGKDCWRSKSWIESPYPEGIKTIWDEHKQAFQDSSVTEYLSGFNPVINGATFESSWQLCFNFPTVNLGCHDLSIPPYILTFIRLLMLVSAGFLCRRLIFGG